MPGTQWVLLNDLSIMHCAFWTLGPVLGATATEMKEVRSLRSSQAVKETDEKIVT